MPFSTGAADGSGFDDFPLDRGIVAVENLDFVAVDRRPVAFLEVSDSLRPRSDGDGVGTEVILAVAIADGERRPHSGADDQVGMIAEQESDCEGALELGKDCGNGILGRLALLDLPRDKVADDFGIGLAFEGAAVGDQLVAKRLEILDDAVVDESNGSDDVRVRIAHRRRAMRSPSRVGDPDPSAKRLGLQFPLQVVELALGPATLERAVFKRADARRVVAAIFEPLEPVEQPPGNILVTDDANNSAHSIPPPSRSSAHGTAEPIPRCPFAPIARLQGCPARRRW